MNIKNIAVHHSGTIGSDPYVSSAHLTPAKVSDAHKARWNFPSQFMKRNDGTPWYGGYNVIYDPKDRKFTQFRAIGEETAAQYGYNFNTFSLCIIGNFMKKNGQPVDVLTTTIETDVVKFLHDLINGNRRNLYVVPGTVVDLAISRVNPHRFYQKTDCYGSAIGDTHFRDLLVKYQAPVAPPASSIPLDERNAAIQLLMQAYLKLLDQYNKLLKERSNLSGTDYRSCTGSL